MVSSCSRGRHLPAIVLLASLYAQGEGVREDSDEALRRLKSAAEQNCGLAKTELTVPEKPPISHNQASFSRGAVGVVASTSVLKGMLFQIKRADPVAFGAVAVLLIFAALLELPGQEGCENRPYTRLERGSISRHSF